jgi:hypothetical protein
MFRLAGAVGFAPRPGCRQILRKRKTFLYLMILRLVCSMFSLPIGFIGGAAGGLHVIQINS